MAEGFREGEGRRGAPPVFLPSSSTARRIPFMASQPRPIWYCLERQTPRNFHQEHLQCQSHHPLWWKSLKKCHTLQIHPETVTGGRLPCVLNETSGVLSGMLHPLRASTHDWCATECWLFHSVSVHQHHPGACQASWVSSPNPKIWP